MTVTMTANGTSTPWAHAGGDMFLQLSGTIGGGEISLQFDAGSGYKTEFSTSVMGSKNLRLPAGDARLVLTKATNPSISAEVATY